MVNDSNPTVHWRKHGPALAREPPHRIHNPPRLPQKRVTAVPVPRDGASPVSGDLYAFR